MKTNVKCQCVILMALMGCVTNKKVAPATLANPVAATAPASPADPAHSGEPTFIPKAQGPEIDKMIAEVDSEVSDFGKEIPAEDGDLASSGNDELSTDQAKALDQHKFPLEINERVQKWISYFSGKDRERFQRFLDRGALYKDGIEKALEELEAPGELYYLAMIESGFVERATSLAGAGGIWQFMPATGRRYGLQVDRFVDERRDTMRATTAAAMYLKDLHNVFNSWYLAMAAYNAGEMRILQGIMKAGTRNFWQLVEKKALPKETMDYIPKFIAASIIGHNPERFGFSRPVAPKAPDVTLVAVPSPVSLSDVADLTGVALEELRAHNDHLTHGVTPANVKEYEIWVPSDKVADVRAQNAMLASRVGKRASRVIAMRDEAKTVVGGKKTVTVKEEVVAVADAEPSFHTVRRGDNLAKIAKKYGKSMGYLRRINGLAPGANKLAVGKQLKLVGTVHIALAKDTIRYRMRRGDNLDKIAKRFNMTVTELKGANDLRRNRLMVGQLLTVRRNDAG